MKQKIIKIFSLSILMICLSTSWGFAQTTPVIRGTITDQGGNAVAAASVNVLKNGKRTFTTITDNQGQFVINRLANGEYTVEITSVGFQNLVTGPYNVESGKTITINEAMTISQGDNLEDVVVVGYGTQKKVNATGAVTTIDSKILEDRPITRLSQGLQGAVANLNIMTQYGGGAPNATQSFNIRGYTGLGTSQGPLIVIDGVQGGDINAINPNDIENISVIKDAAAAAVYGSSAPYGVILITTKRGKAGRTTVTYNNSFTFNTPIGMPKMMNSLDHALIYNEAARNANAADVFAPDVIQRIKDYQAGILKTETQPTTNNDGWLYWGASNANNDWFKIFYKDVQLIQQHNLNFSGGNEKSKYFVGLGYNDKPGMLRFGSDVYRRYNVRANISSKVVDWLEFGLRTSYSKETYNAPWTGGDRTGGNWMHQIARKWPSIPEYVPEVEGSSNLVYSEVSDILTMLNGGRQIQSWDKPVLTGEVIFTPIKNWVTTVNYTYDANIWNNNSHVKTVYATRPNGSLYPINYTYPNQFTRSFGFNYHYLLNAFSSYEYNLNKHNFKLLLGYVRELNDNLSAGGGNNNLYTDNVPSISTAYGKTPWISDGRWQLASEGYFGRFNYNYDEKYLLEITGRYDGSSRFLPDVRWNLYPGISAGWNIHRENFWESLGLNNYINTLKVRGSYGSLGDQSFGDATAVGNWYPFYPTLGTYAPTGGNWYFASGREARTSVPNLVNPDITWVTTSTLNFGVDVTAFNNRLSLTYETYKRDAKDYLGPARDYPAVLGTLPPQENAAAVQTKGFEVTVSWRDNIGDFNYNIRANLSDYQGKITKYPNDLKLITNWYEGEPMGVIYGYETVGYFTGDADVRNSPSQSKIFSRWGAGDIKYADLNGDGRVDWGDNTLSNMGDRKIIGNSTPRYSYGFFADMSWRSWDASFFFQGVGKRDFYFANGINYFWGITGNQWQGSPFIQHNDRWTPSNTDGYFPKMYMSNENEKNTLSQTRYLQNAAYLRLKNIQVGYTIPQNILSRIGIQKLRVFALVENIFVISPMKRHTTIDPETFFSDMKIYPLQRGYSVGLNVTL